MKYNTDKMNDELEGLLDTRLSRMPEQQAEGEPERRSSLAKCLLKNSMQNRMQRQLQEKVANQKEMNKLRAAQEDFSKAFPVYHDILSTYSDSRMFKQKKSDNTSSLVLNTEASTDFKTLRTQPCPRFAKSFGHGKHQRVKTAISRPTSLNTNPIVTTHELDT